MCAFVCVCIWVCLCVGHVYVAGACGDPPSLELTVGTGSTKGAGKGAPKALPDMPPDLAPGHRPAHREGYQGSETNADPIGGRGQAA